MASRGPGQLQLPSASSFRSTGTLLPAPQGSLRCPPRSPTPHSAVTFSGSLSFLLPITTDAGYISFICLPTRQSINPMKAGARSRACHPELLVSQ